MQDLTVDSYKNIKTKAGALLAMLPPRLHQLSQEEKQVSLKRVNLLFLFLIIFCRI